MSIAHYGVIIFPPVIVVIQNDNQKSHYPREVLPVIGLLNTKNNHPVEIH